METAATPQQWELLHLRERFIICEADNTNHSLAYF